MRNLIGARTGSLRATTGGNRAQLRIPSRSIGGAGRGAAGSSGS